MRVIILLLLLAGLSFGTAASSLVVQKQKFTLDSYTTENGQTITPVNIGWEAYGKLNADKSNVILITHYFSGSSHAAD